MHEILKGENKTRIIYKITFSFLMVLVCASSVLTQTTDKCFRGTVRDANEAVIIGAEITIRDEGGRSGSARRTIFTTLSRTVFSAGERIVFLFVERFVERGGK